MILTCPACQKKYLIPDTAIGVEGRQVRCAACRHSWFEAPPEHMTTAVPPPIPQSIQPLASQPVPQPVPQPTSAPEPIRSEPSPVQEPIPPSWTAPAPPADSAPIAEPQQHHEAALDEGETYDAYAHEPPFRRRYNSSRRWTVAAMIASVLLLCGIGAVYYFANPNLLARLGIPVGEIDTPLITQFSSDRGPKEGMPATAPYVTIHGQIINPTDQKQRVPDIIAELLDGHSRVVYSWTITPQNRTIGPKATLPIDDTAVNIPLNARETRLTFSGVDPK